jgi:superoxide reductase
MTNKREIYKCNICGNIVEVLHSGAGELVCCGQPMELMNAKNKEEGEEKHLPVIKENKVVVGEEEHPMEEAHYIEWIEVNNIDGRSSKTFLTSEDKPEAKISDESQVKTVRIYCNIHGLWENSFNLKNNKNKK